jgi:hypothetical protein
MFCEMFEVLENPYGYTFEQESNLRVKDLEKEITHVSKTPTTLQATLSRNPTPIGRKFFEDV